MIKLYIMDMSNVAINSLKQPKLISKVRLEKIKKLKKDKDILLSLGCEFLINKAMRDLNPYCELPVNYSYDKLGKPILSDNPKLYISFSHSCKKVAFVISDQRVGVDIQHYENTNYERIARRFFSKEEYNQILCPKDFFNVWSIKEAYAKFTGLGYEEDLKNKIIWPNTFSTKYNCYCAQLDKFNDYSLVVVCEQEEAIQVINV